MNPPAHLDEEAKAQWRRMLPQLAKARQPTEADLALLEGFATSYSRWKQAEAELAESGPVIRSPQGGVQQSPWLAVARAALRDLRTCLAELGLTAKARKAAKDDDEDYQVSILDVG